MRLNYYLRLIFLFLHINLLRLFNCYGLRTPITINGWTTRDLTWQALNPGRWRLHVSWARKHKYIIKRVLHSVVLICQCFVFSGSKQWVNNERTRSVATLKPIKRVISVGDSTRTQRNDLTVESKQGQIRLKRSFRCSFIEGNKRNSR